MMRLILASQSPRRKQLLTAMGVEFEAIPSKFDEKLDDARDPEDVAKELALGKAMDVAKDNPDAYVIGSDTIVTIDGHQLEKPTSPDDAHDMLKMLAGRTNQVTTGLAIVCLDENVQLTGADTTDVLFKPYDALLVEAYIATGDSMDKAGSYGVQHPVGSKLIQKTKGDFSTVIGLPTHKLSHMLSQVGIAAHTLDEDAVMRALATN